MSESGSVLVVIIDVKVFLSSASTAPQSHTAAADLLSQTLAFLNAYLMLQEHNKLVVFGVTAVDCFLLYSTPEAGCGITTCATPAQAIHTKLQEIIADAVQGGISGGAVLAGALSRALCWTQVQSKGAATARTQKSLILCIVASEDVPRQYVPVMNAIFAAQRHEVVIDACVVGQTDSTLLQQAAHLTGGIYARPTDTSSLLQHLLQTFAVDMSSRQWLQPVAKVGVDFRAACFCHKKPRDMVHVCSVCLSIFCQSVGECTTCGTHFRSASK